LFLSLNVILLDQTLLAAVAVAFSELHSHVNSSFLTALVEVGEPPHCLQTKSTNDLAIVNYVDLHRNAPVVSKAPTLPITPSDTQPVELNGLWPDRSTYFLIRK
jgi:hypothetical protein